MGSSLFQWPEPADQILQSRTKSRQGHTAYLPTYLPTSVADPDPTDPHHFAGSGSASVWKVGSRSTSAWKVGSGSTSKRSRSATLIPTYLYAKYLVYNIQSVTLSLVTHKLSLYAGNDNATKPLRTENKLANVSVRKWLQFFQVFVANVT